MGGSGGNNPRNIDKGTGKPWVVKQRYAGLKKLKEINRQLAPHRAAEKERKAAERKENRRLDREFAAMLGEKPRRNPKKKA